MVSTFVQHPGHDHSIDFMYDLYGALGGNLQMSPPAWQVPALAAEILSLMDGQRTTGEILGLLESSSVSLPEQGEGRRQAIKVRGHQHFGSIAVATSRLNATPLATFRPGTNRDPHARAHQHVKTVAAFICQQAAT